MKHEFLRWAWGQKSGIYGIAVCKKCGQHYYVGNPEGCPVGEKEDSK